MNPRVMLINLWAAVFVIIALKPIPGAIVAFGMMLYWMVDFAWDTRPHKDEPDHKPLRREDILL